MSETPNDKTVNKCLSPELKTTLVLTVLGCIYLIVWELCFD